MALLRNLVKSVLTSETLCKVCVSQNVSDEIHEIRVVTLIRLKISIASVP